MWSIYDTLMLVTGIIVLVISVLPQPGIPAATRLWSGAIGGGLVLLSILLGSLHSFRYPGVVVGGPVIALLALGAVVADARRRTNPNQAGLPFDQRASGVQPAEATSHPACPAPAQRDAKPQGEVATIAPDAPEVRRGAVPTASDIASPAVQMPVNADRDAAWLEVHDPTTSAKRLAGIATTYPEFGRPMLTHPNLYPGLRDWIESLPSGA